MDQQSIISGLEDRARAAGVTIGDACRHAGLHPTTFSRWKHSDRNPEPVGATLVSLNKLDEAISHFEQASAKVAA